MLLGAPIASSFGEVIFWIIELVEDVALCSRFALIWRGYVSKMTLVFWLCFFPLGGMPD